MTLSPEASKVLYADESGRSLTDQLTAAYERNVAQGLVEPPTPADALAAAAATAVNAAKDKDPEGSGELANLDPAFRPVAEAALEHTISLLERIGIETPTLAEFAGNSDFDRLHQAHTAMEQQGLEPQLVFAPVLELEQWSELYQNLQDDEGINHDQRIKNNGLYVDSVVQNHWDELQGSDHTALVDSNGQSWQVLVLPGTSKPPVLDVDHDGKDKEGRDPGLKQQFDQLGGDHAALHPTIATYLTAQATRLQEGETPLDSSSWSWQEGTFTENKSLRAPRGRWDPGAGRVSVLWGVVGYRIGYLGARLPVWGEL